MVLKGILSHFALCQKDTFFKNLINRHFKYKAYHSHAYLIHLRYTHLG